MGRVADKSAPICVYNQDPTTQLKRCNAGAIPVMAGGAGKRLCAAGYGAAGHYADEVGAVLGAGVDVGVEPVLRDRNVLDCVRGEGAA